METPRPGPGLIERTDLSLPTEAVRELALRADEAATRTYRMCGRTLRLRCDSAPYAARFAHAFRRLAAGDGAPSGPASELTFLTRGAGPEGFPALLDPARGRARVFAHEEVEPTQLFFCAAFMEASMFPLPDHAILHASVLERDGRATALVGRTGSGKTTLGLTLALDGGSSFLSDEFCPVRLEDGLVEPFPRVLGLRPHTREVLAARGALPADLAERGTTAHQVDVDPLALRGLRLGRGGRLRNVVVVSGEAGEPAPINVRTLDVEFVSEALVRDLRAVPGVRAVTLLPEPVGIGHALRVEVVEGGRVTEELIRVCSEVHGMQLFAVLPPGARRPDFTRPPALASLAPLEGLRELPRHLANGRALAERLGGPSPARLLDCLAGVLGGVRFFGLRPGPLEETARLVRREVLEA